MTGRERLICLLSDYDFDSTFCNICERPDDCAVCGSERLADYLISNGIIVPPCKVGDKVYEVTTSEEIEQRKVKDIIYDNEGFRLRLEPYFSYEYYLNETVFLTREEAERALKEQKNEGMRYMPKRK